ncbi:MAG: TRAP transporter substrate-binding protein [Casimicrobiaceae bacterium]|nr:TRAP transporter substrate-binding protein [Casimicrobiaceae bacterium]MDW8312664.1 TRAP transporter substrate-binding protein [Burkholderiales bacterium]
MLTRRDLMLGTAGASVLAAGCLARAQSPVNLRLQHFLPAQATIPAKAITPWAQKVERDSGGRIKVQIFPSMQLGGTPQSLFDQVKDGVIDITWTVLGYTPGRFNRAETFELPFTTGRAEPGSRAFHEFCARFAAEEFRDVKVICNHIHGPGLFHTKDPVTSLESLRGMKIRGGSRVINNMLTKLGATPVGMPVPAVTEALSKGVIDGTTIPWEVVPAVKVQQLVKNHTGFTGPQGLYTQTFVFAMNKAAYDKLPADLKKVIDDNSGIEVAALFGRAMDEGDREGRELAVRAGNRIIELDANETARWKRAASAVADDWVAEVKSKNIDGAALIREARALVEKHAKG